MTKLISNFCFHKSFEFLKFINEQNEVYFQEWIWILPKSSFFANAELMQMFGWNMEHAKFKFETPL